MDNLALSKASITLLNITAKSLTAGATVFREQHGYTHGYPEANPHPYPPWVSTHPCGYGYVCGLVGISHGFTHYCHYYHYHLS